MPIDGENREDRGHHRERHEARHFAGHARSEVRRLFEGKVSAGDDKAVRLFVVY